MVQLRKLIPQLLIPLGIGGLAGFLTRESVESYYQLNRPILSPPGWIFPVVWTLLYILMGISFERILRSEATPTRKKQK